MSKPNPKADSRNANRKTPGTNVIYKKAQDNRSIQIKDNLDSKVKK